MASNLPPGVTDAMIEAQIGEEVETEATVADVWAADDAMERGQVDAHHANTCPYGADDGAATDDPAWPGVLFHQHGTVCGRWEGPGGIQAYLEDNGYTPGYAGNPDAIINGLEIDRQVAATVPCPACRQTGAEFESWANQEGGYGVGVAVCQCGHATTF